MKIGTEVLRLKDGRRFEVTFLSHWSDIQAADGETDTVKLYGLDALGELYIGATTGFSYRETK